MKRSTWASLVILCCMGSLWANGNGSSSAEGCPPDNPNCNSQNGNTVNYNTYYQEQQPNPGFFPFFFPVWYGSSAAWGGDDYNNTYNRNVNRDVNRNVDRGNWNRDGGPRRDGGPGRDGGDRMDGRGGGRGGHGGGHGR